MKSTTDKFVECWSLMGPMQQILFFIALALYAILYRLWRAVMGRSPWPRFFLVAAAVSYVILAATLFRNHPFVLITAGFVLGGVLIALLIFTIRNGGNGGDNNHNQ